ncbi:hypothetical protein [Streptomyces sp. NBC_01013]|uniref:hypothetical protein n=1 Tax=Streptomyces sp. NBC_01013 TaxID=2903718 RepID=UPI00386CA270|nr:hypothetical protein OG538_23300 [Streptomyces sp. NBC_01013]
MSVHFRFRTATAALALTSAALVAALAGCTEASTTQGPGGDVPYVAPSVDASAAAVGVEKAEASAAAAAAADANAERAAKLNGPEDVRDAFAGLQATLDDSCTPGAGDCAYVLGRVNEELDGLDQAMKADSARPDHFKEPLGWLNTLRKKLAGDSSTANLEKHSDDLIGTRDRINTWMQGHPEDYR